MTGRRRGLERIAGRGAQIDDRVESAKTIVMPPRRTIRCQGALRNRSDRRLATKQIGAPCDNLTTRAAIWLNYVLCRRGQQTPGHPSRFAVQVLLNAEVFGSR